ncbi:unnamed protein product, partial [Darwinula stevensoni]
SLEEESAGTPGSPCVLRRLLASLRPDVVVSARLSRGLVFAFSVLFESPRFKIPAGNGYNFQLDSSWKFEPIPTGGPSTAEQLDEESRARCDGRIGAESEETARILYSCSHFPSDFSIRKRSKILFLCPAAWTVRFFARMVEKKQTDFSVKWVCFHSGWNQTGLKELEGTLKETLSIAVLIPTKDGEETIQLWSNEPTPSGSAMFKLAFEGNPWNAKESLLPDPIRPYRDLRGRTLRVAAYDYYPFFVFGRGKGGEVIPVEGIDASLLKILAGHFNFTYEIFAPEDGEWGAMMENGSFTGMIGAVESGRADLALTEITITANRSTVVDFTYPYMQEALTFVTLAPGESSRAFIVLSPLSIGGNVSIAKRQASGIKIIRRKLLLQMWFLVLGSIILTTVVLVFLARLLRKTEIKSGSERSLRYSPTKWFIFVIQVLTGESSPFFPTENSIRVFLSSWIIFSLILTSCYGGTLISQLSVPKEDPPLNNLNELDAAVSCGDLTWGCPRGSATEALFKNAEEGIYQHLWSRISKSAEENLVQTQEGVSEVLKRGKKGKKFAFVSGQTNSQLRATILGRSLFHIAKDTFYPQHYGIATPKGGPLKDVLDAV